LGVATATQSASFWRWLVVLLLVLLLAMSIVLLPPLLRQQPISGVAGDNSAITVLAEPSPAQAESPMLAAAKLKFRRESQDLLATILDLQQMLLDRRVGGWANDDYESLQEQQLQAEKAYQRGEYQQSLQRFTALEEAMRQLNERYAPLLQQHLDEGERFFTAADAVASVAAFEQALGMEPDNSQAIEGLRRATLLPQLSDYLLAAAQSFQRGDFQMSIVQADLALALDGEYGKAVIQRQQAQQALDEMVFQQAMSSGYSQLEQQQWQLSRSSFERAQEVFSKRPEPAQAIRQLQLNQQQVVVVAALAQARTLEGEEQWQQALDIYDRLLASDPGLVDAQARRIQVAVRVNIGQMLQAYLDQPLRLADQQVFHKASRLLQNSQSLVRNNTLLERQLQQLSALLRRMSTPQQVEFFSDGLTDVTLFKVVGLGQFTHRVYELKPGKYVVAGGRPGYRDVRVEFTLTGLDKAPKITVQCSETI